jgi:hypothetical protein
MDELQDRPVESFKVDIKNPNTMVVVTNKAELVYFERWCDINNIMLPWVGDSDHFPLALSPSGGGWTEHMDRALFYVRFRDFINIVA